MEYRRLDGGMLRSPWVAEHWLPRTSYGGGGMTTLAVPPRITEASAIDRVIRISTAVAVLAVAGVAAYVSYWHAYAVVRAHGESSLTARLEPATIDGLVYASSMLW